jgi:D-alanine-D-alanine ligase
MKTKLALIYGGASAEHSVSCVTAVGVKSAIDLQRYELIEIGITRGGKFVLESINADWKLADFPEVSSLSPAVIMPLGGGELRLSSGEVLGRIDLAFPLLHGPNGEDGSIQGLLQLCQIPYVGNGVLASAVAMDKSKAKAVFRDAGIQVSEHVLISRGEFSRDPNSCLESAAGFSEFPVFVKPSQSGSSVGVSKVHEFSELKAAIELALSHDEFALVEECIVGREIECSVLEYPNGELKVSLAGEIVVTTREFYDYEAKYLGGGADLRVPTNLSAQELSELHELAIKAFRSLGCSGLARTDFFLTEAGFILTEVNTMPGFTPISMYPALFEASGVSYQKLVATLLETGLTRGSSSI